MGTHNHGTQITRGVFPTTELPGPPVGTGFVRRRLHRAGVTIALLAVAAVGSALDAGTAAAADNDNCIMCRKYTGLGRFAKNQEGRIEKRIYYVDECGRGAPRYLPWQGDPVR
jgi:hypothetical protein